MLFDLFYKTPNPNINLKQNIIEEKIELKNLISTYKQVRLQCIICNDNINSTEHHNCVLRNNQELIIKTSRKPQKNEF